VEAARCPLVRQAACVSGTRSWPGLGRRPPQPRAPEHGLPFLALVLRLPAPLATRPPPRPPTHTHKNTPPPLPPPPAERQGGQAEACRVRPRRLRSIRCAGAGCDEIMTRYCSTSHYLFRAGTGPIGQRASRTRLVQRDRAGGRGSGPSWLTRGEHGHERSRGGSGAPGGSAAAGGIPEDGKCPGARRF
jgi:hypothetical protein